MPHGQQLSLHRLSCRQTSPQSTMNAPETDARQAPPEEHVQQPFPNASLCSTHVSPVANVSTDINHKPETSNPKANPKSSSNPRACCNQVSQQHTLFPLPCPAHSSHRHLALLLTFMLNSHCCIHSRPEHLLSNPADSKSETPIPPDKPDIQALC